MHSCNKWRRGASGCIASGMDGENEGFFHPVSLFRNFLLQALDGENHRLLKARLDEVSDYVS